MLQWAITACQSKFIRWKLLIFSVWKQLSVSSSANGAAEGRCDLTCDVTYMTKRREISVFVVFEFSCIITEGLKCVKNARAHTHTHTHTHTHPAHSLKHAVLFYSRHRFINILHNALILCDKNDYSVYKMHLINPHYGWNWLLFSVSTFLQIIFMINLCTVFEKNCEKCLKQFKFLLLSNKQSKPPNSSFTVINEGKAANPHISEAKINKNIWHCC